PPAGALTRGRAPPSGICLRIQTLPVKELSDLLHLGICVRALGRPHVALGEAEILERRVPELVCEVFDERVVVLHGDLDGLLEVVLPNRLPEFHRYVRGECRIGAEERLRPIRVADKESTFGAAGKYRYAI